MDERDEEQNRDDGNSVNESDNQQHQQETTTDNATPVSVNNQTSTDNSGAGANNAGGYNLNFGALTISANQGLTSISGSLNVAGVVTSLGGQLQGQLTPEGYSISYGGSLPLQGGIAGVNFQALTLNRIAVTQAGLQDLDVRAGTVSIGNNLLTLNGVQANLTGENPNFTVTATSGTANLFGQSIQLTNPTVVLARDGSLREISVGGVSVGNFTAQTIRWDGTNLTVTSAGLPLPEIFGQQISAEFQNIVMNPTDGTYSATGIFNNATTLKFMNDTLQLSDMSGTVQLQNDQWTLDVLGTIGYNQPNVDFTGQGKLTMGSGAEPAFRMENGEMSANLSGVHFTSSGIEYDSTAQVIKILSGNAQVPAFNTQLMASVGNAQLSATGFDFETMTFGMSEGVEMFPGFSVHVPMAQLQKEGTNYKFVLQGGTVTFQEEGMTGGATVDVEYSEATGVQGKVSGLNVGTNFMDITGTGDISFDQTGIHLEGATFKVKNMGPESESLVVTAQNALYNAEGLSIGSLDIALPRLGELNLRAHFDNTVISGGGFSSTGTVHNEGEMNFGNGALKITELAGTFGVASGNWEVNLNANLESNVENVQASGQVNIAYTTGVGLSLTIPTGQLTMNMAGISITSTGITYSSQNFELGVTQTVVNLPEFQGSELTATIDGVTFNREGFNFTNLTIQSSGAMELMPGLTVSSLHGQLLKEDDKYAVILDGSVQLNGALQGGAESVHLEYRESGSTVVVRNFRAETAVFSVSAGEVAYQNESLSIDSADFKVKNLGPGSEALELSATGIVYNSEGLSVATLDVALPKIGDVNVRAHLQGLKATGEGLSLDQGTVTAEGNLTFLQGALKVNNLEGSVNVDGAGWQLDVAGDLDVNTTNVDAGGRVKIVYSSTAGPQLQIENGTLSTHVAGVGITSTGIQYQSENEARLLLTQTNIELPEFADSQLSASITNASYGPQGFEFENVTITSNGDMQLLPGLYVSGLTGTIQKEGENYAVIIDGGVAFRDSALQGGADKVHLEYRNGASSFEVQNLHAHTEMFEVNVSRGTYSNGELAMDTATFKAKGLGPGSESLTVETTGVRYNSEGLAVQRVNVALPKVGDVDISAEVRGLRVASTGVSIEGGTIRASGNISFGNGALTVSDLEGSVNVQDGKWNISVAGHLATSLQNIQAEGDLTIRYDSQLGAQLNIAGGRVVGTYAGVVLTAEGLSYNTQDFTLNVTTARVDIPQLSGGELQTTVTGVRFGPQGFEIDGVAIRSTGTINLFPGVQLSNLAGSFARSGDGYAVAMSGGVNINTPFLRGGADQVNFRYENEQASFSFTGLHIENDLFDFRVDSASYANDKISISQADLNLRNVGPLNGLKSTATGIEYGSEGLQVGSLHAQFPKIGDTTIFADFQNLNVPASGGVTGSATVGVSPADISLAGGKLKVQNISGTASIENDHWAVSISAGLGANLGDGSEAGGDVTITYNSQTGPNVQIANGHISGSMFGIRVAGEGMSYDMQKQELKIASSSLTLMNLGGGITTTVSDLVVNRQGFNFNSVAVNFNKKFDLFPGLNMNLKSGTLQNGGASGYMLNVGVGVSLTNSNLGLTGRGDGTIGYNLTSGKFTGSITNLSIDTGVFDFRIPNGVQFTEKGLQIPTARLQFSDDFDAEKLKQMIPAASRVPAAVLRALKGIAIDATGITYKQGEGLKVTDWNLSILKIPLSIPSIGLNGEINPVDGTGFLEGTKSFDLSQMKIPTSVSVDIPIVGPVVATARMGIQANATIGGRIAVDKRGENFVLSGGLGFNGYVGVFAEILAGVNVGIASARIGAGARFGLNFNGYAGLESEVQYNPEAQSIADKISPVSPIKFGYFLDASLISSIYLVLETEVLWGLWGSRSTWDLAEWALGSLMISGASQGNSFGDLFGGLNNHVAFVDKKGEAYNLSGSPQTLPQTVADRRNRSALSRISEVNAVAGREEPED